MFEAMMKRAEREAARRARTRAEAMAERARDLLPPGVSARVSEQGLAIEGREIGRRILLDPALRWIGEALR